MRLVLVLVAALAVSACDNGRKVLDVLFGVTDEEEAEREGYGDDPPVIYGPHETAAGGGEAGEMAAPDPSPSGDCAGQAAAEAYVRCIYGGMASGSVRAGETPDGPAILTGRYWSIVQQMRAASPGWASVDPLCLCNSPASARVTSVSTTTEAEGAATLEVVLQGEAGANQLRVELTRDAGDGWRVADVIAHG